MPKDWRKAKVKKCKEEDQGNYKLVSLTSTLGNVMEQQILQTICRHIKDETSTRSSQHGIREGKSCLTNLINFCDEVTGRADEVRAAYIVYLDFSKVHLDYLSTWTLTFSLVRYS